jgi:hypothetical protein
MFRPSDPQRTLFDAGGLLPPEKRERCRQSWAGPFREKALPILRKVESEFADLFDPELGRPNRPTELVLGVLILKDLGDLTDQEVLDALEFDTRYWWAFEREPRDLHLCQKTLHNFRMAMADPKKAKAQLAFRRVTDELIQALGVKVDLQRLDSMHIVSNVARLGRLRLICETIRLFLRGLKKSEARAYAALPAGLLRRHGEESAYADARREEGRRRLDVVARDVGRLVERFGPEAAIAARPAGRELYRVYEEQCVAKTEATTPGPEEDDAGDGPSPVALKPAAEVASDSLQTPHDPDVTYSGHKGKGYFAQVLETCGETNATQLIVAVAVTPACDGDAGATVPMVDAAAKAGHTPTELATDTGFSGAANAAEVAARGVNLTAPVCGKWKPEKDQTSPAPEARCPLKEAAALEWQKRRQASPDFAKRYAIRAGCEATNSELARAHGLKRLRVRGEPRVQLALYFKALACNVKRALRCWLAQARAAEGAPATA